MPVSQAKLVLCNGYKDEFLKNEMFTRLFREELKGMWTFCAFIEQFTYLIFIKGIDDIETTNGYVPWSILNNLYGGDL